MASYQLQRRTRLLASKLKLETALAALDAVYLDSLENIEVESYRFDSAEGSQQTKRRSPLDISKEVDILEARLEWVINEIAGTGLLNVQLRRNR